MQTMSVMQSQVQRMSKRMSLEDIAAPSKSQEKTTYQIWIYSSQVEMVREAQASSGQTWLQWSEAALQRFLRESENEIESLVNTWERSRKGKTQLSFQLSKDTLDKAKDVAEKYNGTAQAVFSHAFFMHSLASGMPIVESGKD